MIVLGATGAMVAFEPELDRLFHRDVSYVKPGARTLSLVEIGNAVSDKYPNEPVVAYLPSTTPDVPTQVILSRGIVSVNQYTGEILGVRTRGQSLIGFVRALHVRLAMGDVGRAIVKWSSLVTLLSLFSGLYLWWPVKRMRVRGPWWGARFWYDLHSSVGFFSLLPLLLLAGTGTVIGFEDQVSWLIGKVTASPAVDDSQITPGHESGEESSEISPDQAVAIALAELPGTIPYRVQMPRYGGHYLIALEIPGNRITGERNFISLYPSSGRIASAHLSSALTFRERFLAMNGTIHKGTIWGVPSRIIAALASILLPIQAVSGLLIWLRRKGLLHSR